jgi:hypothetical protein
MKFIHLEARSLLAATDPHVHDLFDYDSSGDMDGIDLHAGDSLNFYGEKMNQFLTTGIGEKNSFLLIYDQLKIDLNQLAEQPHFSPVAVKFDDFQKKLGSVSQAAVQLSEKASGAVYKKFTWHLNHPVTFASNILLSKTFQYLSPLDGLSGKFLSTAATMGMMKVVKPFSYEVDKMALGEQTIDVKNIHDYVMQPISSHALQLQKNIWDTANNITLKNTAVFAGKVTISVAAGVGMNYAFKSTLKTGSGILSPLLLFFKGSITKIVKDTAHNGVNLEGSTDLICASSANLFTSSVNTISNLSSSISNWEIPEINSQYINSGVVGLMQAATKSLWESQLDSSEIKF